MRDPKQFANYYGCTAKDMADLFNVSMSLAEKWLTGGHKASPYLANAIEIQHQQFKSLCITEDCLERQRELLTPSKLEFFDNWLADKRQNAEFDE